MPHFQSVHVMDLLGGTAQTASTVLGLTSDFDDMLYARNPFDILMTPLDRMLSVTIGSTKRKTFSQCMTTPTPVIKVGLMVMENDFARFKGDVTADEASITTKHFVVESLKDSEITQTTEESRSVSWSPLSLRKGFIGIVPSVASCQGRSSATAQIQRPSTFQVDQLYLHVEGDVLISGSQIITKTTEALISGNLTV